VRKQLELHDLEIAEKGGHPLKKHDWKAQDFDYSDDGEVQHSAEIETRNMTHLPKPKELTWPFVD
jgi:hypothetical protein